MGLPAIAAVAIGAGAAAMFSDDDDEAPAITRTKYQPTKAVDEFKPINAMKWMDAISGEEFAFIRDREGNLSVHTRDISGKPAIDAPIAMNNLDLRLPEVGKLAEFNNRYAAAVATLTGELRTLQDTIGVIENTAPELIPQNKALIDSFKAASQKAADKGFDIRRNGIDSKLRQMGLANSSTALGAEIALARERVDSETNNALQVAELGHKTKQQTIANQYQLGQQIVQTAGVELNRYNSESQNELAARGQDLGREQLVQQRGSEQARLNLANEQMRISTELATRQLRAGVMQARNPTNAAVHLLTQGNNQAIHAIQGDNQAMHNLNLAELGQSQLETQRFQANQAAQSNPLGQLAMTGGGALLGGVAGSYGTAQGLQMAGVDPKTIFGKRS